MAKETVTIEPLGDCAALARFGSGTEERRARLARSLANELERKRISGVLDIVPAFSSVTVFYDPLGTGGPGRGYEAVRELLESCARESGSRKSVREGISEARELEIPVVYGGEFGPDLGQIARAAAIAEEEVISRHCGVHYLVQAIGFSPGFPYLSGLPAELSAPRRASPRLRVPAGSVAIGGGKAGVYPLATPGGWQLIGRTPIALFNPTRIPCALLRVGDRVRFRRISKEEFAAWK